MDKCIYLKVKGANSYPSNDFGLLHKPKQILSKAFKMQDPGKTSFVCTEIYTDISRGILDFLKGHM